MAERIESGVIQFGVGDEDWPGLFLRGDNALGFAVHLEMVLESAPHADPISLAVVRGLLDHLRSPDVSAGGAPIRPDGTREVTLTLWRAKL